MHCAALTTASDSPDLTSPNGSSGQIDFPIRDVWIGALVPKRWARRAVTRNAIKRQIYTMSIDLEPTLALTAHLVRLRSGFDPIQFPSASSKALKKIVRLELQQLFERASSRRAISTLQDGAA